MALVPIGESLSCPYLLDSQRRIGPIALSRALMSLGTLLTGFTVVMARGPAPLIALAYGFGSLIAMAAVNISACVPLRSILRRPPRSALWGRLRATYRLGSAALLLHITASLPMVLSGLLSPLPAFEDMGVVTRLWFVISAPAGMLNGILLPVFARGLPLKRIGLLVLAALGTSSVISAAFFFIGGSVSTWLYGPTAERAGETAEIFMLALPPMSGAAVLVSFLVSRHLERWLILGYGSAIATFLVVGFSFGDWLAPQIAASWVAAHVGLFCILVVPFLCSTFNSSGKGTLCGKVPPSAATVRSSTFARPGGAG